MFTQNSQNSIPFYTNFCVCEECNKPLCPKDIKSHIEWHKCQQIPEQIEAMDDMIEYCRRNTQYFKKAYEESQLDIENYRNYRQEQREQLIKKIESQKARVLKEINLYFETLIDSVNKNIQEEFNAMQLQMPNFQNFFIQKFKEIESHLYQLKDQNRQVKTVQKMMSQKFFENNLVYHQNLDKYIKSMGIEQTCVLIDDSRLKQCLNNLSQYILIKSQTFSNFNFQDHNFQEVSVYQGPEQVIKQDRSFFTDMQSELNGPQLIDIPDHIDEIKNQERQKFAITKTSKKPPQEKIIQIQSQEYFLNQDQSLLHYFADLSKKVFILPFDQLGKSSFQEYDLDTNILIPYNHKSLITKDGQIYLAGGQPDPKKTVNSMNIYYLNLFNFNLEPRELMNTGRNSFAFIQLGDYLYALGGVNDKGQEIRDCERYSLTDNKWSRISNINQPFSNFSATSFRNRYIYIIKDKKLECYDVQQNLWSILIIDYGNGFQKNSFKVSDQCGFGTLNEHELMIFGGRNVNEISSESCVLHVAGKHPPECSHKLNAINWKILPSGGFVNDQVFQYQGKLIAIITKQPPKLGFNKTISMPIKSVMVFDGSQWIEY